VYGMGQSSSATPVSVHRIAPTFQPARRHGLRRRCRSPLSGLGVYVGIAMASFPLPTRPLAISTDCSTTPSCHGGSHASIVSRYRVSAPPAIVSLQAVPEITPRCLVADVTQWQPGGSSPAGRV
jgi:hypothetical protein